MVDFLVQSGLAVAVPAFSERNIDGHKLLRVTDDEMDSWGLPVCSVPQSLPQPQPPLRLVWFLTLQIDTRRSVRRQLSRIPSRRRRPLPTMPEVSRCPIF